MCTSVKFYCLNAGNLCQQCFVYTNQLSDLMLFVVHYHPMFYVRCCAHSLLGGWTTVTRYSLVFRHATSVDYSQSKSQQPGYLVAYSGVNTCNQSSATTYTGFRSSVGYSFKSVSKALQELAPPYQRDMCVPTSSNRALRRNRSSDRDDLIVPRTWTVTLIAVLSPSLRRQFWTPHQSIYVGVHHCRRSDLDSGHIYWG